MIGQRLLHYEITDKLGEGGMGAVYAAEDTRLKRRVAIKVLPRDMAQHPQRLARFQREAESVAALSHPNIVTLYSVEEDEGVHFLTMELIEGLTLGEHIPPGGMQIGQLLAIAVPMADAVAAAHEAGIVHRDLKPANVMIDHRSHVRIMDFGLAKLQHSDDADETAAMTQELTQEGSQLGTIPYMSPEQVHGKSVDARSDIFSLGIILYEMATSRRPFQGQSGMDVMSAILRDEPASVSDLRAGLPKQLGRIVDHCLQKDPERRFQTALDLRNELQSLQDELRSSASGHAPSDAATPIVEDLPSTAGRRPRALGLVLAGIAVGAVVWWIWSNRRPEVPPVTDEAIHTPAATTRRLSQLTFADAIEEWPAWSPEGNRLAYSAEVDGFHQLFLREIASGETRQLTNAERDHVQATWAPNGQSLVLVRASDESGKLQLDDLFGNFWTAGEIWKLDVTTGAESLLIEEGFGPAWSPDGSKLAFNAPWGGAMRIWVADGRGRNARQISTDSSEAVEHYEAAWSPDGTRIAYRRREKSKSDIQVFDLVNQETIAITDDEYRDMSPAWSPDGRSLLFSSYRGGGQNLWRILLDPSGRPTGAAEQLTTGAGNDLQIAISPDGSRAAFTIARINSDVWRLPVDPSTGMPTGAPEAFASTSREDSRGRASPDGGTVAFNSDRLGDMNIWLRSVDDGSERQLTAGSGGDYQPTWSPDGSRIAFFSGRGGHLDIWAVDVETGELQQLTQDAALDQNPFYSPDGQSIAYQSDLDGRLEVWVMGADGTGPRKISSTGTGGHFMVWADDGSAIYHRLAGPTGSVLARQALDGGEPEILSQTTGTGSHTTLSPDRSTILDVTGHKSLRTYPVAPGQAAVVFEFEDPDIRIDYPAWSHDGRWVYFDRADYQGSDIWLLEGL